MIPWTAFHANAHQYEQVLDWGTDLLEHRLIQVEDGPSMASYVLNSPMLELAHERQFVISQQGGESVDFEVVHMRRIEECLAVLDYHLNVHKTEDRYCSEHIPNVDHVGLWVADQTFDFPSNLETSDVLKTKSLPSVDYDILPPVSISACSSFHRSEMPATPSLIDVEDSEMSEEFDMKSGHVRLFPDIPRAAYSNKAHGPRQCKGARIRKKRLDNKKHGLATGFLELGNITHPSVKRSLGIMQHAVQAPVSSSMSSVSPSTTNTMSVTSRNALPPTSSLPSIHIERTLLPDTG